ncbi:hypothetical protein NQ317_010919, partial [Molorchus minor]
VSSSIVLTFTQYPKFHSLIDNPGLVPLKLGNAQNVIDHWSFIQIYDVSTVIEEYHTLRSSFRKLSTVIKNYTSDPAYHKEYINSCHLIFALESKISSEINHLNPIPKRAKRGLINGLGSIVKSITGNLDQSDAERYDQAITALTDNQVKIKSVLKDQISLLQTSITATQNNIEILMSNQIIFKSRLTEIEKLIKNTETDNNKMRYYLLLQTLMFQTITSYQIIYDILEKLQVAITFSKLNTFHSSITEPADLLSEILLIRNKLPFEPIIENMLTFEKIMEIKSYNKEIPIVESENYNYYHLYSLPIPILGSFKTIIPHAKYLLLNERTYSFSDAKCQEVVPEEFLCQQVNTNIIDQDIPCVHSVGFALVSGPLQD